MYKKLIVIVPVIGMLLASGAGAETGVNLLLNGGCEDALVGGNIPYWQEVQGSQWQQRGVNPPPFEGTYYFFAGAVAQGELRQTVDLSADSTAIDAGLLTGAFTGRVRSYAQGPPDVSRIIVEYCDAGGTTLVSFDSGERANVNEWEAVEGFTPLPSGTRQARVRLISVRHNGTNNDGYHDDLRLTLEYTYSGLPVPEHAGGLLMGAPYPNPTDGPSAFSLNLRHGRSVVVRVLDSGGRETAIAGRYELPGGAHLISCDLRGHRLAAGTYFLLVTSREGRTARPITLVPGD